MPTFHRPLSRELVSCGLTRVSLVANDESSERGGVSPLALGRQPVFQEPGGLRRPAQRGLALSRIAFLNTPVANGMLLVGVALLSGCGKPDQITSYSVPPHESLQTKEFLAESAKRKPQPARMMAAIVPQGESLWFFKLQGPPDDVQAQGEKVREFLKSLRFSSDDKPEWTLPATWKEMPGNANRHATLVLSEQPRLELSVTVLAMGPGSPTKQLLDNINRWRGQLDLPHIAADDLPTRTETLKAGELTVTLINIVGKASQRPAMPGGMTLPGMGQPSPREAAPKVEQPAGKPKSGESPFNKPAEWTEVPPKQFQLARFTVGEGEQTAEIAVSRAGGDRAANINRWRGQVGLEPLSGEELDKTSQPFEVGSKKGELVEIIADNKTILGVMIPAEGQTWFVKLTGPTAVAKTERSRFEAFAKSLKLE